MSPLAVSFYVAFLSTSIATVLGVAIAAWLERRRGAIPAAVELVFTLPLVLPPTVLGYYLLTLLGRESSIGRAYEHLTGTSLVFTRTGAIIGAAVGSLPLVLRQARAAFRSVDSVYLATARSLGASRATTFFRIELPLAKHGIVAAAILAFARSLGDFGVTLMVSGNIPGETRTASVAIYDALAAGDGTGANRLALTLTAIAASCLAVLAWVSRRGKPPRARPAFGKSKHEEGTREWIR